MSAPLILTVSINQDASDYFNLLRQKHFPPSRNYIGAHLTMFHALPNEDNVVNLMETISAKQKTFPLVITDIVSIGKGVAYKIESPELMQLHKFLQNKWKPFLPPQDQQKLWPHITVQNKVLPQQAKELLLELKESFTPFEVTAKGLQLWEYLNGPWKLMKEYKFLLS